jgi:hypothetical protein
MYFPRVQGVWGNMWGEKWQKGGVLVVGAGGDPTHYFYTQQTAPHHVSNDDLLKSLHLE